MPTVAEPFFHPVPLLAVLVLWVNDSVGKAAFHNALTGKLSDVAGCFVLPLFVAALLSVGRWSVRQRVAVGAVATTVFFGALKTWPAAATLTAQTLEVVTAALGAPGPHRIVVDHSDLWALVMVPVAVTFALGREPRPGEQT